MGRPATRPWKSWTLDEARALIAKLQPKLEKVGANCALTGSVLYKGESAKDVDLIVFPHDTGGDTPLFSSIAWALETSELRLLVDANALREWWREQGIPGRNRVEVWTAEGKTKRVDVIYLGWSRKAK